ncbi:PREDICTED: uncharacterized protein LOC107350222 isoform X1 [Acropora digitifera]|uniref:uncharacterized protein LOC107350222 isoform X1 n=1 Tax=Acropora digitifera TaxID=70779 RepID=UPI00077AA693|nr:PREDICTED: uncharacterized protein LOC107350222 isoform X1 [Acropora digitifera]
MSEIVTSLLKAVAGFLVDKARNRAAEKLKEGDVTANKIRELIQREINDIKSKLDALSRKDLLTALDAFQVGVRYLHQALDIDSETIRSATSTKETLMNATKAPVVTAAIERGIKNVGITEFGIEAKDLLLHAQKRFEMAREEATKAFNNEALDTLQRITAIRYRVMAAMLESVAKTLAATTYLSSLSLKSALQSATPECEQSLRQLHALPDVKKNFKVELRSGPFSFRWRFGRAERREIICAVCQVNRFIHDAQEFDFDHYDWAAIKIGEKSINPLYSREVREVLDEAGMQQCCVQIEWSFGDKGEEGHRLSNPTRIAANTLGEFLVVDFADRAIKVFDSSGEFIYKINPQVDDTVTNNLVSDVATDVNNNTYILVFLSESGTDRHEVQVFTKTEMCKKFPVRDDSFYLTVSHDRVFVASRRVIVVYDLNGIPVGRVGEGTLSYVRDIAAGSDGQIFVLNYSWGKHKIVYVFTEDGHQHNNFRVDSAQGDDPSLQLASYPSSEHIVVFSGFELTTRRLKLAMYRKDGVFNRLVTLAEKVYNVNGIAVTNDGSVAISILDQEDQRKVIVRPMKPY